MRVLFALILGLAGCAATPVPENHDSVVVVSRGELGTFSAHINGDDRVTVWHQTGIPGQPEPEPQVIAGAYARALEVVRSTGPAAMAAAGPAGQACYDWGHDMVRVLPPLPEFDAFLRECPTPALTQLMVDVLAAVPVTP